VFLISPANIQQISDIAQEYNASHKGYVSWGLYYRALIFSKDNAIEAAFHAKGLRYRKLSTEEFTHDKLIGATHYHDSNYVYMKVNEQYCSDNS
jgi:hypothetical protein